jgi:hypothetical protein
MKKTLFLILIPFLVYSQKNTQRIGGGLESLPHDPWLYSPHLTYEYQVGNFIFLSSNLGLINKNIPKVLTAKIQRIMLDFDVKFVVFKYKNINLKMGTGPSFWYENVVLPQLKKEFTTGPWGPIINYPKTAYENRYFYGLNVGFNVCSEFEIQLSKNLTLNSTFDIIAIKKTGLDASDNQPSFAFGLGGLYKIK